MTKKISNKIFFVDAKQLESEGVSFTTFHTSLEIECFNKVFDKVSILAKSYREKAISLCEEYLQSGYDTFITESPSFFSIWKEKKTQPKEEFAEQNELEILIKQGDIIEINNLSKEKSKVVPLTLKDVKNSLENQLFLETCDNLIVLEQKQRWLAYIA